MIWPVLCNCFWNIFFCRQLISKIAPALGGEVTQKLLLESYLQLCMDSVFHVRKVSAWMRHWGWSEHFWYLFFVIVKTATVMYDPQTLAAVPSQLSLLFSGRTIEWVLAFRLSNNNKLQQWMWTVAACRQAQSISGLVAALHYFLIHRMIWEYFY